MKKIRGQEVTKEYVHFGETLDNDDLSSLRSAFNKNINELLRPGRTVILDLKKEVGKYYLFSILGLNLDNSRNYFDHQKFRQLYETMEYSEAMSQCLGVLFLNECNEVSALSAPDHPMVRREFIQYQRDLRQTKREMTDMIAEKVYIPLDTAFGNVNDTKKLEKDILKNRQDMMKLRDDDAEKFNILWTRGDYHLATIIARLEQTNYPDTLMMREEILKRNNISVEIKDYGLIISDIMNGLQVAKKSNERYWYKAFSEGNVNLRAMILLVRNHHMISKDHHFVALQTMQALANDFDMRRNSEDPAKYETIRQFIRKYNLPVHANWKRE